MMSYTHSVECEECGTRLYRAGDTVPAGNYVRVDDGSFHPLSLSSVGPLPASFDGHVAQYRAGAAPCLCERRQGEADRSSRLISALADDAVGMSARTANTGA